MKTDYVRIISFQGECVDGYINGKADVLYEKINADGQLEPLRIFGWFSDGQPVGKHIFLSGKVLLLVYYHGSGKLIYTPAQKKIALWSPNLTWSHVNQEVQDIEGQEFKDSNGRFLPFINAKRLFDDMAVHGSNNSVTSVKTSEIQDFLKAVSLEYSFAGTNRSLLGPRVRPDPDPITKLNEVYTKDGCKFKVLATSAKDEMTLIAEEFEVREWSGVCVDGWAHGPGTTTRNFEYETRKSVVNYEWVQMGSPIGRFTIENPERGLRTDVSEGYYHPSTKDIYFIKSNLPDRQPEIGSVVNFSFIRADGSRVTFHTGSMYASDKCGKKSKGCILRNEYLPDRYYGPTKSASEKHFPCDKDCPEIWESNAGPMLDEMDAFITKNKPKVEEIISSNISALSRGTTLQQRQNIANQAKENAKQKAQRYAAVLAKQDEVIAIKSAENKSILDKANLAKTPVQSPNLDTLIKKIPSKQTIRKKGKQK
jgi:hypothetical protein